MTGFNAVRFKVKDGRDQEFLDAHSKVNRSWPGMRQANIIKTGEHTYCIIAEGDDRESLAKKRPHSGGRLEDYVPENRLVPRGGVEPPTLRFSVACSTN